MNWWESEMIWWAHPEPVSKTTGNDGPTTFKSSSQPKEDHDHLSGLPLAADHPLIWVYALKVTKETSVILALGASKDSHVPVPDVLVWRNGPFSSRFDFFFGTKRLKLLAPFKVFGERNGVFFSTGVVESEALLSPTAPELFWRSLQLQGWQLPNLSQKERLWTKDEL